MDMLEGEGGGAETRGQKGPPRIGFGLEAAIQNSWGEVGGGVRMELLLLPTKTIWNDLQVANVVEEEDNRLDLDIL
jgi:hypothetical protein